MNTYYLQDSRMFLGNTVVWWATDGGYTIDITKAMVYTREEADSQVAELDTNIPWPKEYIDQRTTLTVDVRSIERRDVERAIVTVAVSLPKESL